MLPSERQKSTHCGRFPHDTGWTAVDPKPTFPLFNPTGAQSPVGVDQSAFAP